jgi:rSAM/selenodomain-associated transferase 2
MSPTAQPEPSISVVVPVLNERAALPRTLAELSALSDLFELIVVDGGSTDGTLEWLAEQAQASWTLLHSAPGRGRQMNRGAAAARGDWLLFHHADSSLPPASWQALRASCADPQLQWGGFRHCFAPPNWKLRLISALHNLRCRLSGAVYGDQSMFARRSFFESLGGFPDQGLEDLVFSDRALARAPSMLLPESVHTDARKFRAIGEFRAFWQVVSIVWRYEHERPVGNARFFEPYR